MVGCYQLRELQALSQGAVLFAEVFSNTLLTQHMPKQFVIKDTVMLKGNLKMKA